MNIIAFDPGQKGGIAIHSQGVITAHPMPLAGKTLDLPSIADLVRSHSPSIAVIEKVGAMPGQGVTSTFTRRQLPAMNLMNLPIPFVQTTNR
jgi:crossover junction endodeoxyribonuclease RuvC